MSPNACAWYIRVMPPSPTATAAAGGVLTPLATPSPVSDFAHSLFHHLRTFVFDLAEIAKAASWLAVVFSAVGLVIAAVLICVTAPDSRTKLLGTLFVTALCFAANHLSAYLLGIFIIATLVTELEFLEKLAAIFWNRKEYWEYLTKRASTKDVDRKLEREVQEEQSANQGAVGEQVRRPESETVQQHARFEKAAVDALEPPMGPLRLTKLHRHILFSGPNIRFVVDAVGQASGASYIIEVKFARRARDWQRVADQLTRYAEAFVALRRQEGRDEEIRKIMIIPPGGYSDCHIGDAAVLHFDIETGAFTNLKDVQTLFPGWHWKE
ncbi:MAG: hypothetical protein QOH88_3642 [Verrucomicrobiota bacterium]